MERWKENRGWGRKGKTCRKNMREIHLREEEWEQKTGRTRATETGERENKIGRGERENIKRLIGSWKEKLGKGEARGEWRKGDTPQGRERVRDSSEDH